MNINEKPHYDILNRKLLQFSFHRALTLKSLQNVFFKRGAWRWGEWGEGGGGKGKTKSVRIIYQLKR